MVGCCTIILIVLGVMSHIMVKHSFYELITRSECGLASQRHMIEADDRRKVRSLKISLIPHLD